jgi:putative endonuclease
LLNGSAIRVLSAIMKRYWVYLLASASRTLYAGVTNTLVRRIHEHKTGKGSHFTSKYRIGNLVHLEESNDIRAAIAREKQIKGWDRKKKIAFIEAANPKWEDLAAQWYETTDSSLRSE